MRHAALIRKTARSASGPIAGFAKACLAAFALSACASLGADDEFDLTGASPEDVNWAQPRAAELEQEVARLSAENEALQRRIAELERRDAVPTPAADAGSDNAEAKAPAGERRSERRRETVVASADVDGALSQSPAPPVDPAPRLVQPTFASERDTVFENEADSEIATASVLYGVHLASYRRLDDAQTGWRRLQRDNPDELGLLEPRLEPVSIEDQGEFLRLIAGGFATQEKAAQLCERLKARRIFCAVTHFGGERLTTRRTG